MNIYMVYNVSEGLYKELLKRDCFTMVTLVCLFSCMNKHMSRERAEVLKLSLIDIISVLFLASTNNHMILQMTCLCKLFLAYVTRMHPLSRMNKQASLFYCWLV